VDWERSPLSSAQPRALPDRPVTFGSGKRSNCAESRVAACNRQFLSQRTPRTSRHWQSRCGMGPAQPRASFAIAAPMPLFAPVMNHTWSFFSVISCLLDLKFAWPPGCRGHP
jgi:hypothetical protein